MWINLIGGVVLTAVLGFLAGYFIRSRIGQDCSMRIDHHASPRIYMLRIAAAAVDPHDVRLILHRPRLEHAGAADPHG